MEWSIRAKGFINENEEEKQRIKKILSYRRQKNIYNMVEMVSYKQEKRVGKLRKIKNSRKRKKKELTDMSEKDPDFSKTLNHLKTIKL